MLRRLLAGTATLALLCSPAYADGSQTGGVASFAGRHGAIVPQPSDIQAGSITADKLAPGVVISGPQGATGPASNLSIGNIITGPAGTSASAGLRGVAPNQILDLTIPAGATGAAGASVIVRGTVSNYAALPTTGQSVGDLWIMQSAGTDPSGQAYSAGDGYVFTGGSPGWTYAGPLRGPQGPAGTAGAQGAQGYPTTVNGKSGVSIALNATDVGAGGLGQGNTWTSLNTFGSGIRLPRDQWISWIDTYGGNPFITMQGDNNLIFYNTNTDSSTYPIWAISAHTPNSPFNVLTPLKLYQGGTGDLTGFTVQTPGTASALGLGAFNRRGLYVTPQMFGAQCNSNGTSGNGNDDTAAIQAAVNYAEQRGLVMFIPGQAAGYMCRTTSPIQPHRHLTIDGTYCEPYNPAQNTTPNNTPGPGSWLFFDHAGAGIFATYVQNQTSLSGLVLQNFCTYRSQPAYVTSGSWAPNENYDYDLSIGSDDTLIRHVITLNPTKALYITGRAVVEDLRGSPYLQGINAPASYDILKIKDIHFWPFATINPPTENYKHTHLEALVLGRVDNPMIENFFAIGAKTCIHMTSNSYGSTNKAKFVNTDCDLNGSFGVLVDGNNTTAQFSNFTAQGADNTGGQSHIVVNATNVHMTFDNVRGTYAGNDGIVVNGGGSWVVLNGLMEETWGMSSTGCAVSANNGGTVMIGPGQLFAANGANGSCLYGGNGTVQTTPTTKAN